MESRGYSSQAEFATEVFCRLIPLLTGRGKEPWRCIKQICIISQDSPWLIKCNFKKKFFFCFQKCFVDLLFPVYKGFIKVFYRLYGLYKIFINENVLLKWYHKWKNLQYAADSQKKVCPWNSETNTIFTFLGMPGDNYVLSCTTSLIYLLWLNDEQKHLHSQCTQSTHTHRSIP